ncbi:MULTISPECIES: DUF4253 domain-containing protein [unclassified Streptomyces]|uniref:DUF4253 domain-containing protein n=1 Tax=unclassified Streptomyces TaxID=2593676 RepID=UPI0036E66CAB
MEATLPPSLPPGRIIESYGCSARLVWMSDGKLPDADAWWRRLYAQRARTGLYPVLLEYCEDWYEPTWPPRVPVDVAAYLRDLWEPRSWPTFPHWPGLAVPAATGLDPGACAAEVATGVVREDWARCLALVEVERGTDAPAALHWPPVDDALTALLHSWEDRFGAQVVALTHGGLFVSAANPPKDLHEAHVLAGEHYLACPDVFHNSFDDWENTYPRELMTRREWYFWWD